MFFIAGYHPVTKDLGPTVERRCPHCHNQRYWLLQRRRYYISLFFIPLIPLRTRYGEYCPICGYEEPLRPEQAQRRQQEAELNRRAVQENWSETRYAQARRQAGLE